MRKNKGNKNLEAISLSGDYDRPRDKGYLDFLFSMITNDSSLTRDVQSSTAIA
jgi:hypothetical protein